MTEDSQTSPNNSTAAAGESNNEFRAGQGEIKTQISAGESKPSDGKITADEKAGCIATFATYEALIPIADTIAAEFEKIKDSLKQSRILIVESPDFAGPDIQVIEILNQINMWDKEINIHLENIEKIRQEIEEIIKTSAPAEKKITRGLTVPAVTAGVDAVLQTAKGAVSMIADIVGYFKVDYEIKGQTIELSIRALQSLVASRLISKGASVLWPGFYHIPAIASLEVIKVFNQCISDKDKLKKTAAELQELLNDPIIMNKKNEGSPKEKSTINTAEKACENVADLIKEFVEFNKALTAAPEKGGYSPLAATALRQHLAAIGITHLLYIGIPASGGEMVTGKGLFYFGSPGFLGGCVVTYLLVKITGELLASDTIFKYSGVKYHLNRNTLEVKNQTNK
jgi:hypothetical protein